LQEADARDLNHCILREIAMGAGAVYTQAGRGSIPLAPTLVTLIWKPSIPRLATLSSR